MSRFPAIYYRGAILVGKKNRKSNVTGHKSIYFLRFMDNIYAHVKLGGLLALKH